MDEKSSPIFLLSQNVELAKLRIKKFKKRKKMFIKTHFFIFFLKKLTFFQKKITEKCFFLETKYRGPTCGLGGTHGLGGHTWTGGTRGLGAKVATAGPGGRRPPPEVGGAKRS
jgi:hypothetical protein